MSIKVNKIWKKIRNKNIFKLYSDFQNRGNFIHINNIYYVNEINSGGDSNGGI